MFVILAISFFCISFASSKKQDLIDKYPPQNCNKIERKYKDREDNFREDAWKEFEYNKELEVKGKQAKYSGPLECYCERQERLKEDNVTQVP